MRKDCEDCVKSCMEIRGEGRRSIGRLRETWLETVESYMAELEIDREDIRDGQKWRRNVIKKEEVQLYRKRTINR